MNCSSAADGDQRRHPGLAAPADAGQRDQPDRRGRRARPPTRATSSSRPKVVVLSSGIRARGAWLHRRQLAARDGAEDRVVAQDAGLELLEGLARLDAELVGEPLAGLGVDGDRLFAAAAAVERGHEQRPQPLSGRVLVDQAAHARDQLAVPALLQRQVAAVFQRGERAPRPAARPRRPGAGSPVRRRARRPARGRSPRPGSRRRAAGCPPRRRPRPARRGRRSAGRRWTPGRRRGGGRRRCARSLRRAAPRRAGRAGLRARWPGRAAWRRPTAAARARRATAARHPARASTASRARARLPGSASPVGDRDRHRAQQSHLHTWRVVTGPDHAGQRGTKHGRSPEGSVRVTSRSTTNQGVVSVTPNGSKS